MHDTDFDNEFRTKVETYLREHNMKRYALAERMHISPQLLSEILSGAKTVSLETKLKLLHFMDNKTNDENLDQINDAVLRRFAAKGMQIRHFTSGLGLTENDGFVPQEGKSQPDLATNVAELIRAGNIKEATDLLKQVQKGSRVTASSATRANVNVGSTRSPMVVKGDGSRAVETEDGLTFHTKNGSKCLDHSPETVAAAKKSLKSRNARVAIQTTKRVEKQIKFSGPMNPENVKMDRIRELQRNLATQSNDLLSLSIREE